MGINNSKNQNFNDFDEFLMNWSTKYFQLKGAVKLINLYPSEKIALNIQDFINEEQLDMYQTDWLRLINKLDKEIDKKYFKPWFVPITKNEYKWFVDLMGEGFPIIEPIYDTFNYKWFHLTRFENIIELILRLDEKNISPLIVDKKFSEYLDKLVQQTLKDNPKIVKKLIELKNYYARF